MTDRTTQDEDRDAQSDVETDHGRTGRVVVGADVSALGSAALLWAMRRARRGDGHVMVLDSRPHDDTSDADASEAADAARKGQRWEVQAWASEVLMGVGTRVPVLVSTTEGRLELALAGAGSRADLVVFGGEEDGSGPLDPAVLLRFCPCPVVRVDRHQQATWLGATR
ncbi:universal stress protein [Nocardioidaceae bacterium]|nr:universal stress protein [Nocardioidaceae bacterium]